MYAGMILTVSGEVGTLGGRDRRGWRYSEVAGRTIPCSETPLDEPWLLLLLASADGRTFPGLFECTVTEKGVTLACTSDAVEALAARHPEVRDAVLDDCDFEPEHAACRDHWEHIVGQLRWATCLAREYELTVPTFVVRCVDDARALVRCVTDAAGPNGIERAKRDLAGPSGMLAESCVPPASLLHIGALALITVMISALLLLWASIAASLVLLWIIRQREPERLPSASWHGDAEPEESYDRADQAAPFQYRHLMTAHGIRHLSAIEDEIRMKAGPRRRAAFTTPPPWPHRRLRRRPYVCGFQHSALLKWLDGGGCRPATPALEAAGLSPGGHGRWWPVSPVGSGLDGFSLVVAHLSEVLAIDGARTMTEGEAILADTLQSPFRLGLSRSLVGLLAIERDFGYSCHR
mmetsp:Transcript_24581/g.82290  ORF Transcript_24581/g.82290 Transcript_24581/m.82290 type:complete len:407 (-) Transcript_24581:57-1277(-)